MFLEIPNRYLCLEDSFLIEGNSGTQSPSIMWFRHFQFISSKVTMLICIRSVERKGMWMVLWARPGAYHFRSHSIFNNLVTWLHLTSMESGSVTWLCAQKEEETGLGKYSATLHSVYISNILFSMNLLLYLLGRCHVQYIIHTSEHSNKFTFLNLSLVITRCY